MRLPSPSYREYTEFVTTVLATIILFQYFGILGPSGAIEIIYLVSLGLSLPVFTYLLTVVCENVDQVPQWDRMVQNEP